MAYNFITCPRPLFNSRGHLTKNVLAVSADNSLNEIMIFFVKCLLNINEINQKIIYTLILIKFWANSLFHESPILFKYYKVNCG